MNCLVRVLVFVSFLATFVLTSSSLAQTPPVHYDHAGMSMAMDAPVDPAEQATLLQYKRESEFNHHLSGFFLILAGLLIFAQSAFHHRIPGVRYAWPICFLLSGAFVLVFSDTELWPFGPKSWIDGVFNNHEVLQHKTFAVMLLALGSVELARARNKLTAVWSAWIFPAVAIAGSLLLLFHSHNAGMHGPDHMTVMARIQMQHFSYSGVGFAIGLSKGLAEVPNKWQSLFTKLYPVLTMVLGALLVAYVE
jgi:copper resistance protein D